METTVKTVDVSTGLEDWRGPLAEMIAANDGDDYVTETLSALEGQPVGAKLYIGGGACPQSEVSVVGGAS